MTEAGSFQLDLAREGDVVQDSQVTRAGSTVLSREVLVPLAHGYEVFRDETIRPDGSPETRVWNNYPEGAVMVVPYVYSESEGQDPEEATIYLAKDLRLYGLGKTDGLEALDSRKHYRDAAEVAHELAEGVELEVEELRLIGSVNETSGRQRNVTDIAIALLKKRPDQETLERNSLTAKRFAEIQAMIKAGVIDNAATISALYMYYLDQVLTSFPREDIPETT